MSSLSTVQGVVHVELKDRKFDLPRLTIRDYLPLIAEVHEKRKKLATELIPQNVQGIERFNLRRMIALDEPTLDQFVDMLWQMPWQIKIIEISFQKGKLEQADRDLILDGLAPVEIAELAFRVSGLRSDDQIDLYFHPPQKPQQQQQQQSDQAPTFGNVAPQAQRPLPGDASENQNSAGQPTNGASGTGTSDATAIANP
jgi:hypothetical protein